MFSDHLCWEEKGPVSVYQKTLFWSWKSCFFLKWLCQYGDHYIISVVMFSKLWCLKTSNWIHSYIDRILKIIRDSLTVILYVSSACSMQHAYQKLLWQVFYSIINRLVIGLPSFSGTLLCNCVLWSNAISNEFHTCQNDNV